MDITSFIRSKEVAEYCHNIGKTWNTCEMAVIIDRSNCTITDKHAAWMEIVEHCPDMPAIPNYHGVRFDSVHEKITERIAYEKQAIDWFMVPKNNVFYQYSGKIYKFNDDGNFSKSAPFMTFEKAFADLNEKWMESDAPYVYFNRVIVDDSDCQIYAEVDHAGNLYNIKSYATDEVYAKWFPNFIKSNRNSKLLKGHGFEFAELFFIDIPIPFKRGDILTSTNHGKQDVFVFDSAFIVDNPERYARCLCGDIADDSDMNGWGLLVNDDGALYGDHTEDYDSFVSYNWTFANLLDVW